MLGEYWYIIILSVPVLLYYGYYVFHYFRYVAYEKVSTNNIDNKISLEIIAVHVFQKRLIKKILAWLFLVYSASFLAAVLPANANDPVSHLIYFFGMVIYLFYLLHIIVYVYYYKKHQGNAYYFSNGGIISDNGTQRTEFPPGAKVSLFQVMHVLHFNDDGKSIELPLFLLDNKEKQNELLDIFQPQKSVIIEKGKQGLEIFESIVIALILAMHIRQFGIQAFYIPSGSMEMTLRIGDHLLVDKFSMGPFFPPILGLQKPIHLSFLDFSTIKRGDILIFRPPIPNEYREFIKRVVALPGDTFEIKNGEVYINDKKIDEPYVNRHTKEWEEYYAYLSKSNPMFLSEPSCPRYEGTDYQGAFSSKIKIPADKYLMLGDHRDNSSDSRSWGLVPRKNIRGKAWILYFNYYDMFVKKDFQRIGFIQ